MDEIDSDRRIGWDYKRDQPLATTVSEGLMTQENSEQARCTCWKGAKGTLRVDPPWRCAVHHDYEDGPRPAGAAPAGRLEQMAATIERLANENRDLGFKVINTETALAAEREARERAEQALEIRSSELASAVIHAESAYESLTRDVEATERELATLRAKAALADEVRGRYGLLPDPSGWWPKWRDRYDALATTDSPPEEQPR